MKWGFFFEEDTGGGFGGEATEGSGSLLGSSQHSPEGSSGEWSWTKDDGSFSEGWMEKLPEELQGNASLRVIGSLPDLAKSYIETKALTGKRMEAPGEGASREQIAAWRRAVGAPESVEGYFGEAKSLRPESVPEEFWDAEGERRFAALAHKHHLPTAAVKDILNFYGDSMASSLAKSKEMEVTVLQAEGAKLRRAFGQEYDASMAMASRMAQTAGLDPKSHPIFTNAEVVQAFAKLGRLFSEDRLVRGETRGISSSLGDRVRDITDPKSESVLAREYRGEFGPDRQLSAQQQYHQLLRAHNQR